MLRKKKPNQPKEPMINLICCAGDAQSTATFILMIDIGIKVCLILPLYADQREAFGPIPFVLGLATLELIYYWAFGGLHDPKRRSYSRAFYLLEYLIALFLIVKSVIMWHEFFSISDAENTVAETAHEKRRGQMRIIIPQCLVALWCLIAGRLVQLCVFALLEDDYRKANPESATAELNPTIRK